MGAYRSTYFGVYLRIPNTEETITEQYYRNSNGNKAKTKFNPETGEEHSLITKKKTVVERFNHYDVLEDFEDSFFSPEYIEGNGNHKDSWKTLLANTTHPLFSKTLEEYETFDLPIGFSTTKAVEAFEEYYMAELKILRDNNVEFTFHCGIVNYAH